MLLRLAISAITAAAIASTATYAQNASFGSPAEAKALLEKVVISMKADPAKTVSQINKGEEVFATVIFTRLAQALTARTLPIPILRVLASCRETLKMSRVNPTGRNLPLPSKIRSRKSHTCTRVPAKTRHRLRK